MTQKKSRVEWVQDLERWKASGKSIAVYCKEIGVSPWALRYWRDKIQADPTQPLVPIPSGLNLRCSDSFEGYVLNITPGLNLRLPSGTSPHFLATLIRELSR